jgi:hypothetical protein
MREDRRNATRRNFQAKTQDLPAVSAPKMRSDHKERLALPGPSAFNRPLLFAQRLSARRLARRPSAPSRRRKRADEAHVGFMARTQRARGGSLMVHIVQEKLSITLSGGPITGDREKGALELERMFALMGKVASDLTRHSYSRFGLQTVCAISDLTLNGDVITVNWTKRDFFISCSIFVERAWREIAGPNATVTHKLNSEPVVPKPIEPGSYGAGDYGAGTIGGEG